MSYQYSGVSLSELSELEGSGRIIFKGGDTRLFSAEIDFLALFGIRETLYSFRIDGNSNTNAAKMHDHGQCVLSTAAAHALHT